VIGFIKDTEGVRQDCAYIIEIIAPLPATYAHIAYRKEKGRKAARTKKISCPHCGRLFEEVDVNTRVQIYRVSRRSNAGCHSVRACKACHRIIGLKYA